MTQSFLYIHLIRPAVINQLETLDLVLEMGLFLFFLLYVNFEFVRTWVRLNLWNYLRVTIWVMNNIP